MKFINEIKRQKNIGRCLHYNSGKRCNKIVNAHSIQKKHLVDTIAVNGHAYRINADFNTLKKNNGEIGISKVGIKKLSTFLGFCKQHDNELFEEIDNNKLIPTDKQVMLYAYRCLCREYFVKENSLKIYKKFANNNSIELSQQKYIKLLAGGTENGFNSLKWHKDKYDESLEHGKYNEIEYVAFLAEGNPTIYFSGVLFPDSDFLGKPMQNLMDTSSPFQYISFFSAPIDNGWAYVFAWHKTSKIICRSYMQSLASSIHSNNNLGDTLFRHIISCCENHAISPLWWDRLNTTEKNSILNRAEIMAHPTTVVPHDYLLTGLEGISKWSFPEVRCNYQNI